MHFAVQEKLIQHCKATILQLNKNFCEMKTFNKLISWGFFPLVRGSLFLLYEDIVLIQPELCQHEINMQG